MGRKPTTIGSPFVLYVIYNTFATSLLTDLRFACILQYFIDPLFRFVCNLQYFRNLQSGRSSFCMYFTILYWPHVRSVLQFTILSHIARRLSFVVDVFFITSHIWRSLWNLRYRFFARLYMTRARSVFDFQCFLSHATRNHWKPNSACGEGTALVILK